MLIMRISPFYVFSLLVAGSVALFCAGCGPASGSGSIPEEANKQLWDYLKIPLTARDVSYAVDRHGCEANFELSEQDFLAWCRANGWDLSSIDGRERYPHTLIRESRDTHANAGYTFSFPDGVGIYDRERNRVDFVASTFP